MHLPHTLCICLPNSNSSRVSLCYVFLAIVRCKLNKVFFLNGDGNKNMHCTFWYISLPSLHDLDVKFPVGMLYGRFKHTTNNFSFSFLTWARVVQELDSRKFHLHLTRVGITATAFILIVTFSLPSGRSHL